MLRAVAKLTGAVTLCLVVGLSALAEEKKVTLSPDELREAAALALRAGDAPRAYAFSEALLQRDETDRTALLIHSRSARDLGRYHVAKASARSAWKLAETDEQKFSSSMVMAQALSSDGKRTYAQLWLRRAAHHAPNEQMSQIAARDFRYVRARNPWLTQLNFSVTPDSNINNGSAERSSFLYRGPWVRETVHSGTARPLSGVEYSLGVNTRYRFAETGTRAHDLTFYGQYRTYTLSSEAKAQAPSATGSDFAFGEYMLGYAHKGINLDRRGEYRLSGRVGQNWYGGDEYSRFFRLSGGQFFRLKEGRSVRVRVSGERLFGVTRSDADTVRTDFSYSFPLPTGAAVWTNLTLAKSDSTVEIDDYQAVGLQAQVELAKPVFGATALIGLSAQDKRYDASVFGPPRQEETVAASFTLIFRQIDYYGFNPTMRISGSNTDSNINRYKAKRFGVNFGIQSAF
ncbi:MAG: DUF560 domain-containing protein [Rhodobacteraceae bacterium]|nr:DUF560 domain-containing protein [Paracoccaceae bacterium]